MKFYFEVGEDTFEIQAPDVGKAMEYMNRNVMDKQYSEHGGWSWHQGKDKKHWYAQHCSIFN